jgi:hypothetical protein
MHRSTAWPPQANLACKSGLTPTAGTPRRQAPAPVARPSSGAYQSAPANSATTSGYASLGAVVTNAGQVPDFSARDRAAERLSGIHCA